MEDREAIRRAYFVEHKSIRAIARELQHGRNVIREALASAESRPYARKTPRPAPQLGAFKSAIDELLAKNANAPRKQRYTARKIFQQLKGQGYTGSEVTVRRYVAQQLQSERKRPVFLPLEFDPGRDAQVDWGEAEAILDGHRLTIQFFELRLNFSRKVFARAYPAQKQEAFFDGHVAAFHYLGGVPHTLTYDNLTPAVRRVLEGHRREEQRAFVAFRSHYLFDSRFCTPGQGHEKGGVESGIGFVRRNFLVPLPNFPDFDSLNAYLLAECQKDDARTVERQPMTIGQAWALEQPHLRPLPAHDFDCCVMVPVTLNAYSQVTYETNRYSVPVESAYRQLVLKAYPFHIEVLHGAEVVARHPRSYGRQQEIYDPLHYLPLLEQRPGAFEHAKPVRQWRARWSPIYEQLLADVQANRPDGDGIPEFVRILKLHRDHPAALVEQATPAPSLTCVAAGKRQAVRCVSPGRWPAAVPIWTACVCGYTNSSIPKPRWRRSISPTGRGWPLCTRRRLICTAMKPCSRGPSRGRASTAGHLSQAAAPADLPAQLPQAGRRCRPREPRLRSFPAQAGGTGDRPARTQPTDPPHPGRALPDAQGVGRLSRSVSAVPKLNKAQVLDLARGAYIEKAEPILLVGNPGLGKSHVATGLGLAACRQGHKVRFYNAAGLVNEMLELQEKNQLSRFMTQALKQQVTPAPTAGAVSCSTSWASSHSQPSAPS